MYLKNITAAFCLFVVLQFCSCKEYNVSDCLVDSGKFQNAYNYPDLQNKKDTDIFSYAIKDSLSERDSFLHVTYGMNYFKKFNEQNFSLRFLGTETFRFSYDTWALNITFNKDEMIVKTRKNGVIYEILNKGRLDSNEIRQINFFERNYFANKEKFSPARKAYYDSMIKKYPELLSLTRYKTLYDKAIDYDSAKFEYDTKIIKLSSKQYCNLIDSLNATDFWSLPWRIDYPEEVADGGGYSFEANTKHKYKIFICYGLPIDSIKLTGFCKYLIEFAGLSDKISL
ncbi:MAG: hypothetical protein ABI861_05475 [Panacibacter sp.]